MRNLAISGLALAAVSGTAVLWYGGTFDGVNGSANEVNTTVSSAKTYDDFLVSADGAFVTSVWSNNLLDSVDPAQAEVEIRSGVTAGNGGTLVFSGTFPVTKTPTGRSGLGMSEYEIEVSGLNVYLPPGSYHLSVAPIGAGSGRSFLSTTSGDAGVGAPIGNGNSFVNSQALSFDWEPASAALGPGTWDFSMGVDGFAIVHPATLNVFRGLTVSGGLSSLFFSDDERLVVRPGLVLSAFESPVTIIVEATSPYQGVSELRFILESHASVSNIRQTVELFNFVTGAYEEVHVGQAPTTDTQVVVTVSTDASRFVQAGTRLMRAQLRYKEMGPVLTYPWQARIDQAIWAVR